MSAVVEKLLREWLSSSSGDFSVLSGNGETFR